MLAEWHVTIDGKPAGPFTAIQLTELVKRDRLRPADLVRKLDGPWTEAVNVEGLFSPPMRSTSPHLRVLGGAVIVFIAAATTLLLLPDEQLPQELAANPPHHESTQPPAVQLNSHQRGSTVVAVAPLPTAAPTPSAVASHVPSLAALPTSISTSPTIPTPAATSMPPSVNDSDPSIVPLSSVAAQVVTTMRSSSRRRSAIVLDSDGHVLTFSDGTGISDSVSVWHAATNKMAAIQGYAAVAPGKNMVLLRTDLKIKVPPIHFGAAPKVGDKLSLVAVRSPDGFESVASGQVTEKLSGQSLSDRRRLQKSSGLHDYDGRFFCVDLPEQPEDPAYFFANEAGEIVGLVAVRDREGGCVWGVEIGHVEELSSMNVGQVRPMSELNRRTMRNGRVILVTDLNPRGGGPKATASAVAPISPALAASPPPGPPAPSILGVPSLATPGDATSPPTASPSSTMSDQYTNFDLDAPFNAAGWTSAMQDLDLQRRALQQQRESILATVESLVTEAKQREAEYRQIDAQAVPLRQRFNFLQARINDLNLVQRTSEVQRNIDIYRSEQASLDAEYNRLAKPAAELQNRVIAINAELNDKRTALANLKSAGDESRRAFMKLMAPFQTPAVDRGQAAVAFFDPFTKADSQPAFAYFGRGMGHLLCEKLPEALADFDRALTLVPDEPTFLAVRGLAHLRNGEAEKARDDLAKSTLRDAKNSFSRYIYALLHCRNEVFAAAETQLKESQKIDSTDLAPTLLLALLKSTAKDGAFRNGKFALTLTERLPTDRWDVLLVTAAAKAETGDFTTAAMLAEKAGLAAPTNRKSWCDDCAKSFRSTEPLRIDWKTFEYWKRI